MAEAFNINSIDSTVIEFVSFKRAVEIFHGFFIIIWQGCEIG